MQKLPTIEFPRQAADTHISLIICCDSSKLIYGFSCYGKSASSINLIFAKAKTAPTKSKSLPTLELLSVFLAIKCLPTILDSLTNVTITDLTLCVDAQVVLSWLLTGNVKAKNIFASNRIKDIRMLTDEIKARYNLKCIFKYLPTEMNPADLLTRGLSFREFEHKLPFWQHGPPLFAQNPILWPDRNLGCLSDASKLLTCNAVLNSDTAIFPVNKFSSVNKLFRVTTLVFKFISKLRKDGKNESTLVQESKLYWLKHEQLVHFQVEYNYLNNPTTTNVPTTVKNLNLFLDGQNVIRCKGRLDKSDLSYDLCNPVLLPRFSFLTELYVWDAHQRCLHMGTESTLNFLRKSGLWIPKGRARVKSVLRKCITCKKINAHAFKYPKPTNLIADRVKFNKPFQYTGVDFTGHVYVKHNGSLIKMFILVFTCLNIRAIHLELLPSMTCQSFLMAFIRFCNLNEIPDAIYSDNANSFIAGMGIVAGSLIDNEFNAYLTKNNIRHIRIPLYSAWVGSMWERMIRTIKGCLHKVTGRKHHELFALQTLLSDIQQCINSRPLTYLNEDTLLALTPNCFLKCSTGRSLLFSNIAGAEVILPGRAELVKALESREQCLSEFKDSWYSEYLLSLREVDRDMHQIEWHDKVSVGDIVLVASPNKPRANWQLGRVEELLQGADEKTRCVKVYRPDGSVGVYSINLLYPLEINVTPTNDQLPEESRSSTEKATISPEKLPKRQAALKCLERIKRCN